MKTLSDFVCGSPEQRRSQWKLLGGRFVGDPLKATERLSEDGCKIICSICNEPRFIARHSSLMHKDIWSFNDQGCRCDRESLAESVKKERIEQIRAVYRKEEYMRISKGYLSYCGFSDDFYKRQPENIRQTMMQVKAYCKFVVDGKRDKGLYLYSSGPGLCKTASMACARNLFLDNGIPAILTNIEEIVEAFLGSCEMFDIYCDVDVLIVDDIGIQDPKELMPSNMGKINNALYELVNNRMLQRDKPTLFTSNFTINELLDRGYKPQTVDRIRGIVGDYIMKISGSSIR